MERRARPERQPCGRRADWSELPDRSHELRLPDGQRRLPADHLLRHGRLRQAGPAVLRSPDPPAAGGHAGPEPRGDQLDLRAVRHEQQRQRVRGRRPDHRQPQLQRSAGRRAARSAA